MDNNNATLVEAKRAYTNQLVSLLTPQVYEGIKYIYESSKQNMKGKNIRHSFQLELQGVSLWNQIVIDKETERIIENTQCKYLDKLVTVIFINSTKILASAYIGQNATNTLEISVPKLSHFIHYVYIETAKEFYKNPYLFDENIISREKQDNLRSSIECIKNGINQAILKLLPIEDILTRDINSDLPQLQNQENEIKQIEDKTVDEELNEINQEQLDEDEEQSDEVEEQLDEVEEQLDDVDEVNEVTDDNKKQLGSGRVSPINIDEIQEEPNNEENYVRRTLSDDGSGININKINEENKEFINENKDETNLVENIADEINLKNINITKENNILNTNPNNITINKLEEPDIEEPDTPSEPIVVGNNYKPDTVGNNIVISSEETVSQPLETTQTEETVSQPLETIQTEENVSQPLETIQEEENVLQTLETTQEEENVSQPLETIQEEEQLEMDNNLKVINEHTSSESDFEENEIKEEAENMIKNIKDDLQNNKTKFVNPYRMRRKRNEKRLERLRNVKIKKKYLVDY
jgi:hypothetical protein